jgi:hypothetical protein
MAHGRILTEWRSGLGWGGREQFGLGPGEEKSMRRIEVGRGDDEGYPMVSVLDVAGGIAILVTAVVRAQVVRESIAGNVVMEKVMTDVSPPTSVGETPHRTTGPRMLSLSHRVFRRGQFARVHRPCRLNWTRIAKSILRNLAVGCVAPALIDDAAYVVIERRILDPVPKRGYVVTSLLMDGDDGVVHRRGLKTTMMHALKVPWWTASAIGGGRWRDRRWIDGTSRQE